MSDTLASRIYQLCTTGAQLPSFLISKLRVYCSWLYTLSTSSNRATSTKAPASQDPPQSRFRMGNETSATMTLLDGRKLGYALYGAPSSKAIFYLHGLPGSRIEAAVFDEHAVDLGVRIIGVDRPSIGWSSPQPERKILDHADDIEQLAKHLDLEDYGVLGISGGGPYALACAASLPSDRLKAVTIVCGLGPPDMGMKGSTWLQWLGFTVGYRYFPGLTRRFFQDSAGARTELNDNERFQLMRQQLLKSKTHDKDIDFINDEGFLRLSLRAARETYAQGFDGLLQDGKLMSLDFGFRIEDIRRDLPIQLWYGKLDVNVPPTHGEQTAQRLGGSARLRIEDETHASLFTNWRRTFLQDLVESMEDQ